MVEGLGLTTAELMLARTSAIRHLAKCDKPACLLDLMSQFGIDFLTLRPLSPENIQGLTFSSSAHWDRLPRSVPKEQSAESDAESS